MRITLMTDRAEYVLRRLGDKCHVIDTDAEFTRIQILDADPLTMLKLFHAGTDAGYNDCLTEFKKKFKTSGFSNY